MKYVMSIALLLSGLAFGHDEGHGPKLSDSPKQGGKVASVVDAKAKGDAAAVLYKSELVQDASGNVKVYLYDREMNQLDQLKIAKFAKDGLGVVEHLKKGKVSKTTKFPLELKEGVYVGKFRSGASTPTFNVDVKLKEGNQDLVAAFKGLEAAKN